MENLNASGKMISGWRKTCQKLCDDNLETLFSLKLVKSQFAIENFRIDSLAFDEETKALL